jgi:hypothetical protein
VWERHKGQCCACGRRVTDWPPGIAYHHIFPKDAVHWPELVDDPMNVVLVCAECHSRHETAVVRLPIRVTDLALEWCARDEAMVAYLTRTYAPR